MFSIDVTDMDLCLLALEQTVSIKAMKTVLPYGVKNKLKYKNWIFIKKELSLVKEKASKLSFDEDRVKSFFFPECIYILKKYDKYKLEMRETCPHTYIVEKAGENGWRITEPANGKAYIDELIGYTIQTFYENVLLDKEIEEFNEIMEEACTDGDENLISKCKRINASLEHSDYTLERYYSDGIDIIVWNERGNEVEFCITENKLNGCRVKIGELYIF